MMSGSGGGAGKATVSDLEFTHQLDRASPNLTRYCFTGKHIDEANPDDVAVPNIGPLPKGVYYLVDRQSGGFIGPTRDLFNRHGGSTDRRSWFTLWNPVSGDTTNIDGIKRGIFRLHPMGTLRLSEGCITVQNSNDFDRLQKYIRSRGRTLPVPRTTMKAYGTAEVK